MSKKQILKEYYAAMESHDWDKKRSMLRDDFVFRGPLMETDSADELIEGVKQMGCRTKFQEIEMLEVDDTVMSFFTLSMDAPFEGKFRMAERVKFDGDKLKSSELIYDARNFPA